MKKIFITLILILSIGQSDELTDFNANLESARDKALLNVAKQGDRDAQYMIADLVLSNETTVITMSQAVEYLRKSALQGMQKAQEKLALMYVQGKYVTKDIDKGIYWFKQLEKQGNVNSKYALGEVYAIKQDFKNSLLWMHKASESGNLYASYLEAMYHMHGKGAEKNEKLGEQLLNIAAKKGEPNSLYVLGKMRYSEKNYDKAIVWLQQAADANHLKAINDLTVIYMYGLGVKSDFTKAHMLIAQGVALNDPRSHFNLGITKCQGRGIPQNFKECAKEVQYAKSKGINVSQVWNEYELWKYL